MKIKGTKTEHIQIEVSEEYIKELINKSLLSIVDLYGDVYLKDGEVIKIEEFCGSHCWDETTIIRKATELDKAVFLVLKNLKNIKL